MSTYTPPTVRSCHSNQYIYHTPETTTNPSVAVVQRKRQEVQGIVIPSSTRLCLRTLKDASQGLQNTDLYTAEYSQQISGYDEINRHVIEQVPDYVTDIYKRLYSEEVSSKNLTESTSSVDHLFKISPF
jgi:hypothetical protein